MSAAEHEAAGPAPASVEGGCLCGAIRYRLHGAPLGSIVCHCASCRRAGGAPSVAWLTVDAARFEWLRGAPREFRSSPAVVRSFCPRCGTPLTYVHAEMPQQPDVTTASLDDPARFPPTREVWLEHKLAWEAVNDRIGRYPRGTGDGPLVASA